MGVTSSDIRLVYTLGAGAGDADVEPYVQDMVNFFNRRFELYGRRLTLTTYTTSEQNGSRDIATMHADAAAIAGQKPFGEIEYQNGQFGESYYFYDDLARHGIISSQAESWETPLHNQAQYAAFSPYEWNFKPSYDQVERAYGEIVCKELAGRAPRFAGVPQSQSAVRKWGLIYQTYDDGTPSLDTSLVQGLLRECGVAVDAVAAPPNQTGDQNEAVNAVAKLQADGVTSVLLFMDQAPLATDVWPAAAAQNFHPEWYWSDFFSGDDDKQWEFDGNPGERLMTLQSYNKFLPAAQMPYYWAVKAEDPNANIGTNINFSYVYLNLLLLASGIQMSGAHLTPNAFERGLTGAAFPNPGADGPPYYQARVGFGPDNHAMADSFGLAWFDPAATSNVYPTGSDGSPGAYCWVWGGRRYSLGAWPSQEPPFFQPPCSP